MSGCESTVRLLGAPAVGEQPLRLRPKEWALLARVALAGAPVPRADLARLLFADADDPRGALRWHLNALRGKLPPAAAETLRADGQVIALGTPTDVTTFRTGAAQVRDHPGAAAHPAILDLYRGDLCEGLAVSASPAFDTWLYVEQESLRRLFRQAAVAYGQWAIDSRQAVLAIPALSCLVAVAPYVEEGHVLLISAYESMGDREAVKSAYTAYQRIVREELQAEPRPALTRTSGATPRAGRSLPRDELVALEEITAHIVEWPGEEPAILAVPGTAGSAYSLTGLGERLAPRNRFIAMDLRGHGFSDKPPGGYDLAHHVRDTVGLVDALELDRPILLGFCIGGPVAAGVAGLRDSRGLILMDAAIGGRRFLEQKGAELSPGEANLDLRYPSVDEYIRAWRSENGRYSDEAERWVERFARFELAPLADGTFRRRGLRLALEDEFQSVLEADTLAMLAAVGCPVLVVRSSRPWPGRGPWLTQQAFGAQIQACRLATAFEAHHSTHPALVRDPEPDLVAAIRRFSAGADDILAGKKVAGKKVAGNRAAGKTVAGANGLANGPWATLGSAAAQQGAQAPLDPQVEMEAFIRWLALDREQVRNYRRDPVGFLTGGRVSEPVRAALTKAGVEAVLARVRDMAEALHGPPDSWAPSSFNRDPSATGYGRRPAGGAQGDQC